MKTYRLVDNYEGFKVIFESYSFRDCVNYAKYYEKVVTDGECSLKLYKRDYDNFYYLVKDFYLF